MTYLKNDFTLLTYAVQNSKSHKLHREGDLANDESDVCLG